MQTLIEQLAGFVTGTRFEDLSGEVVHETKRLLLDAIGCALGGAVVEKGRIAIEMGKQAKPFDEATMIGTAHKVSTSGAAFANGELINALEYEAAIMPPGPVPAFVIPAALALAEKTHVPGRNLIVALALAFEISGRLGGALGSQRDIAGGKIGFAPVHGYSSTIFGGTAAAGVILGLDAGKVAHAMGLGGYIAPVQTMSKWVKTTPAVMTKYLMAGWMAQAELTAVRLAATGYTGDIAVLEGDYGFWRFAGSNKWNPAGITAKLGDTWRFPAAASYKPYPSCGIFHTALDCFISLINRHDLQPGEIEAVKFYIDAFCDEPIWQNKEIKSQIDAQFSAQYNVAVAAHRVRIGPEWLRMENFSNPKIVKFMEKVSSQPHPDYVNALAENSTNRLGAAEIVARGQTFREDRKHRRWTRATEATQAKDSDLINKFKANADMTLKSDRIDAVVDSILNLEKLGDVSTLLDMLRVC